MNTLAGLAAAALTAGLVVLGIYVYVVAPALTTVTTAIGAVGR